MTLRVETPPERYGIALEDDEEEVNTAKQKTASDKDVDDVLLDPAGCDAQKKEADGNLEKGGTGSIEDFTEIPELISVRAGS